MINLLLTITNQWFRATPKKYSFRISTTPEKKPSSWTQNPKSEHSINRKR